MKSSLPLYREAEHHARAQMLSDMTVKHPLTGIRHLDEQVHGRPHWNDRGVFPDKVLILGSVHRSHKEALPVDMDGMIHRVERVG